MQNIDTTKYIIHIKLTAEGIIEKPDIVGAIFGQTEGIIGNDLDLRDLQKTGRIGRIEVLTTNKYGKTKGTILVPSSLDKIKTSIIAASIEIINKVGPCTALLEVIEIEDIRSIKRSKIIERAKSIYSTMFSKDILESQELYDILKESVKAEEIVYFGKNKYPAGPYYKLSKELIIVEGRADVLTLLKYGIKNTLSVCGTNITKDIIDFIKDKTVTIFTDSDRGGELIIKELLQLSNVDFIAKPPFGKSVEDLLQKEVIFSLKHKIPIQEYLENNKDSFKDFLINQDNNQIINTLLNNKNDNIIKKNNNKKLIYIQKNKKIFDTASSHIEKNNNIQNIYSKYKLNNNHILLNDMCSIYNHYLELNNTSNVKILTSNYYPLFEFSIKELIKKLKQNYFLNDILASVLIFDGIITQNLIDLLTTNKFNMIIGRDIGLINKNSIKLKLYIINKVRSNNSNL